MGKNKILRTAYVGCGARGQMYAELASEMKDKFILTAAADPVKERINKIEKFAGQDNFAKYLSADDFFAQPKLADIVIISTQDAYHFENCKKAIELGYDVLLEKPVATRLDEILELEKYARERKSRVMVCYVLRFSPFYLKIKEFISSGMLGDIINMNFVSGISPWRMAHSFVRGHWANTKESTPTIVAKACHDTDIIYWLLGRRCKSLTSYGALNNFRTDKAPKGVPERCTGECTAAEICIYNALRYTSDKRFPWLPQIYDNALTVDKEEIINWLRASPWGRCVYHCDNNAPDHQTVSMLFEDEITCTFTMTAFESGRHLEIYGTKGVLKGGETFRKEFGSEIIFMPHKGESVKLNVTADLNSVELRKERDRRLIKTLYDEMTKPAGVNLNADISDSIHSHLIAFAAENARLNNCVVNIDDFQYQFK